MYNVMDALSTLVENGLTEDAAQAAVVDLLENDELGDDDDKRCCVAYDWYRDQGNKCDPSDVEMQTDGTVCIDGAEYRVMTDDEADQAAADHIRESVWSFNASFLSGETGIDETVFSALSDKCEGAQDEVRSIIDGSCGMDSFIESAVGCDGRGHFLGHYDNEENEHSVGSDETYYLYRTN